MHNTMYLPGMFLLWLVMSGPLQAQEVLWYLTPSISYIIADNDRQTEDGVGYNLGIGTAIDDDWNLELYATVDSLELNSTAGEYRQRGLGFDGLYIFNRRKQLTGYAVIGAGVMNNRVPGGNTTNAMGSAGLGIMAGPGSGKLSWRLDVRCRYNEDDESRPLELGYKDWLVNLGVMVPLSKR